MNRATIPVPRPAIRDAVLRERLMASGQLVPFVEPATLNQDWAGRMLAANQIYCDGLAPTVMLNRFADPEVRAHLDHLEAVRRAPEELALPWSGEIFAEPEEATLEPEPVAA